MQKFIQHVREVRQLQIVSEADRLAQGLAQTILLSAARGDEFALLALVPNGNELDDVLGLALNCLEVNGFSIVKDEGKLCTYYLGTWEEKQEKKETPDESAIPKLSTSEATPARVLTSEMVANELVGGLINMIHTTDGPDSNPMEYDFIGPFETPNTINDYHVTAWLTKTIDGKTFRSENVVFCTSFDDNINTMFTAAELNQQVAKIAAGLFKTVNK